MKLRPLTVCAALAAAWLVALAASGPALAAAIGEKGLKPGIWTNAAFAQTEYAAAHKEWFVLDPSGAVARGNGITHQVFIIRERLPRPQLIATGRHITGGAVGRRAVS